MKVLGDSARTSLQQPKQLVQLPKPTLEEGKENCSEHDSPQQKQQLCKNLAKTNINLHVNLHDDENIKPIPINAVVIFLSASERLVVAAFFIICVSSESLLRSSPVRVTS